MKKKFAGLVAALLVAGTLAGCGGADAGTVTNADLNQMEVEEFVTLGDYSNISVEVEPAAVDQEQWDQLLLAVYQSNVTAENGAITDRAVKNGDTVIIDYEGKKDGVAFSGGTASDAELVIGSGTFIDGFEEGLIGVMPGKTVDLNLTFPEAYHSAELAGQAVVFTVTVDYILPGLDEMEDSAVSALGLADVTNLEELRQYVYDYLLASEESNYLYNVQNAIFAVLMEDATIQELPTTFVDSYNHVFIDSLESMAAQYGVDADTYSNYFYGMDSLSYAGLYAEIQARQEMLLQAIANKEGLTVSDEELQTKLEELTAEAGFETVEEMLGDYTAEEYRNYFMSEKVMDFLMENATITAPAE